MMMRLIVKRTPTTLLKSHLTRILTEFAILVDSDDDDDGVEDFQDVFPLNPEEWSDADEDGVGDNSDEFPTDDSEWVDSDDDGYGDNSMRSLATQQNGLIVMEMEWVTILTNFLKMVVNG